MVSDGEQGSAKNFVTSEVCNNKYIKIKADKENSQRVLNKGKWLHVELYIMDAAKNKDWET